MVNSPEDKGAPVVPAAVGASPVEVAEAELKKAKHEAEDAKKREDKDAIERTKSDVKEKTEALKAAKKAEAEKAKADKAEAKAQQEAADETEEERVLVHEPVVDKNYKGKKLEDALRGKPESANE